RRYPLGGRRRSPRRSPPRLGRRTRRLRPGRLSSTKPAVRRPRSYGAAADVPDGALRGHRPCVRERAQDLDAAADRLLVESREAAPHHLWRGAVAEPPRAAEAERALPGVAGRVDRGAEERGALEVVGRG